MVTYMVLPGLAVAVVVLALIGYIVSVPIWIYLIAAAVAVAIILGVRAWRKKNEPTFPIRTLR